MLKNKNRSKPFRTQNQTPHPCQSNGVYGITEIEECVRSVNYSEYSNLTKI